MQPDGMDQGCDRGKDHSLISMPYRLSSRTGWVTIKDEDIQFSPVFRPSHPAPSFNILRISWYSLAWGEIDGSFAHVGQPWILIWLADTKQKQWNGV